MKKIKLFLVFIGLFYANFCYSQNGWFWQNPLPTASHINDCYFVNQDTGFAAGYDGLVLKTTNGGNYWSQLNTKSVKTYTSVHFISNEKGYLITGDASFPSNNFLMLTTNSGSDWTKIFTFPNQHLTKILFLNENTGFITGGKYWVGGRIYKTTNAGLNWLQYTPDPTTNFIYSIYFINKDTGYVTGNDGKILKTTNCGLNWVTLNSGTSVSFNDIYFINEDSGYVCGKGGKIYKTTNAGENWFLSNTSTNIDLFSITFINSQTGFAAGGMYNWNTGRLLKTINGGLTWDSISFNNYSNFRKIYKSINNELYLGGYFGAFYKSNNLGLNWNSFLNYQSEKDLSMAAFKDQTNGILVGWNGYLAQTSNSGNTWNQIDIGINNNINVCKYITANTYIAAGSSGLILKSSNNGSNWESTVIPGGYSLRGIDYINPNLIYIVGSYTNFGYHSIMLKSTNSGITWTSPMQSTSDMFCNIKFINNSTGFITTVYSKLYTTTNGGNTWSITTMGVDKRLNAIHFINENTGYLGTVNGIFKTTNQGVNWSNIQISAAYLFEVSSVYFTNESTGFLTGITYHDYYGKSGVIFKTIDGGNNWYNFSDNNNLPYLQERGFSTVSFINDTIGFIYGDKGTILKTNNGGLLPIGLQNVSYEIPRNFTISQNYPNPFNPQTKIKFDVPKASFTKLIVYDLLGREISTLVNEELKPGTYEADWDGSNYSSGVYFYKIITNDFTETRKMVLMK